jgi:hypothetical protein
MQTFGEVWESRTGVWGLFLLCLYQGGQFGNPNWALDVRAWVATQSCNSWSWGMPVACLHVRKLRCSFVQQGLSVETLIFESTNAWLCFILALAESLQRGPVSRWYLSSKWDLERSIIRGLLRVYCFRALSCRTVKWTRSRELCKFKQVILMPLSWYRRDLLISS